MLQIYQLSNYNLQKNICLPGHHIKSHHPAISPTASPPSKSARVDPHETDSSWNSTKTCHKPHPNLSFEGQHCLLTIQLCTSKLQPHLLPFPPWEPQKRPKKCKYWPSPDRINIFVNQNPLQKSHLSSKTTSNLLPYHSSIGIHNTNR